MIQYRGERNNQSHNESQKDVTKALWDLFEANSSESPYLPPIIVSDNIQIGRADSECSELAAIDLSRPVAVKRQSTDVTERNDNLFGHNDDQSKTSPNFLSCDFLMFLIDMTCCFLILAGILGLLVLACTVGIPYIPIISALSAQQISTCALSAMVCVATGAVGLALSCFFKPKIEVAEKQASELSSDSKTISPHST